MQKFDPKNNNNYGLVCVGMASARLSYDYHFCYIANGCIIYGRFLISMRKRERNPPCKAIVRLMELNQYFNVMLGCTSIIIALKQSESLRAYIYSLKLWICM